MVKPVPSNELIKFLYRETSPEESADIDLRILCDTKTAEEYYPLAEAKEMLDQVAYEPSPEVINRILQHAKRSGKKDLLTAT